MISDETVDARPVENSRSRRMVYHKPVLEWYGDVRDITLGGSPGILESGVGGPRNFAEPGQAPNP